MAKAQWQIVDEWVARGYRGKHAQDVITVAAFDHTRALLDVLSWSSDVNILGAATTTLEFSHLPSDECLDDNIIDLMVEYLAVWA
jgi:hypothetical protein